MNKKGAFNSVLFVILVLFVIVGGSIVGYEVVKYMRTTQEAVTVQIQEEEANGDVEKIKEGGISYVAVYVSDKAAANEEANVKAPVYCIDDLGSYVIDSTLSKTTQRITGQTNIGRTVTCYAFNGTFQSIPVTFEITQDKRDFNIPGYTVSQSAFTQTYDSQLRTQTGNPSRSDKGMGTGGGQNITLSAAGTATIHKMRTTNNNTAKWLPIAGYYFNLQDNSTITEINIPETIELFSMDHAKSKLVTSSLSTAVSQRKRHWDVVYEFDDDPIAEGNQPLIMDEGDYLETGTIEVKTSAGCGGDTVAVFAFPKGYFKSRIEAKVKFGHETDGDNPGLILQQDWNGTAFKCKA